MRSEVVVRTCFLAIVLALAFGAAAAQGRGAKTRSVGGTDTVVFASNRTGRFAVYATNPARGGLAQLAPADAEVPVPAPDGSAVAFMRSEQTGPNYSSVYVARANGASVPLPGCSPLWGYEVNGSWSPDSKHFACTTPKGIEVISADGSSSYPLVTGNWHDPAWSPNGNWIAFENGCIDCSDRGVWVAPATGGKPVRVAHQDPDSGLVWSPNSKELAFFVLRPPNFGQDDLFVARLTGSRARRLARNVTASWPYDLSGTWSPNGRRIAIGSKRGLLIVNAASGAARLLTHDGGLAPAWSPNGRQIAYMVPRTKGRSSWDIALIGADGRHRRLLTHGFPDGGTNASPAWSRAALTNPLVRAPLKIARLRPTRRTFLESHATLLAAQGAHAVLGTGCDLWKWDAGGRPSRIRACRLRSCWGPPDLSAVLADQRIAWGCPQGKANQFEDIQLATRPYSRSQPVAFLAAADGETGGDVVAAMLAAGGSLLFEVDRTDRDGRVVVGRSTFSLNPRHERGSACPDDGGSEFAGHTHGCQLLKAATNCALLDAAHGVIVVRCPDGTIRVLNAAGRLIRTVPTSTPSPSARTDGTHLLVLDGLDLSQYEIPNGHLLYHHTLRADIIPPQLAGTSAHFAAYLRGTAIHIIHLSDGRDLALRPLHLAGQVLAQLDRSGLLYEYTSTQSRRHGAVGFLSNASIRRLFSSHPSR